MSELAELKIPCRKNRKKEGFLSQFETFLLILYLDYFYRT